MTLYYTETNYKFSFINDGIHEFIHAEFLLLNKYQAKLFNLFQIYEHILYLH